MSSRLPMLSSTPMPRSQAFVLETERLHFRCWQPNDIDLAMALWGNPQVAQYIFADGSPAPSAVQDRLNREIACLKQHGFQYWPIFLREGGAHVGCCGLRPYRLENHVLELGVHLRPEFWRKGFAVEAATAVIRHSFDNLAVKALFAGHNPNNTVSRQMLLRLGFRYSHDEFYPPTGLQHPSYFLKAT